MCGIAGVIRFDGIQVAQDQIELLAAAIAHRGPDGEGVHVNGAVGLGHRRLSIIDIDGGQQPMSTPDQKIWVTYNGEIYNFLELRKELEGLGHEFSTRCDTEVILFAWKQWGKDCVKRFRGMFAFCLVDYSNGEFLIARDHFGIKPLLYAANELYLAFASELVALEKLDELTLSGSTEAIQAFLTLQYIPDPLTIYNEVKKLPPAHLISGKLNSGASKPERYWDGHYQQGEVRSPEEWLELADATISTSVSAHTISDVPIGAFVSGGIDSSLIAYYMNQLELGPDPAFSIGFEEETHSELKWAQQVASKLDISLCTKVVTPKAWENLEDIVCRYGEPFGDNSMIPTFSLAKLARSKVAVCLSGDAGDEGFGGYNSYKNWLAVPGIKRRWRKLKRKWSKREWSSLIWAIGRKFGRVDPNPSEWLDVVKYSRNDHLQSILNADSRDRLGTRNPPRAFETVHRNASQHELLAYAQEMDFSTYLPGCILTKVDIASMAHSLEVRTPLLDLEVVGLAHSLPLSQRAGGDGSAFVGKSILKDLLTPVMGDEFVHRKKQGFGIPRKDWLLPGRGGHTMLAELLASGESGLTEWFDEKKLQDYLQSHSPTKDHSAILWLLLVLGIWRKHHKDISFS